MDKLGEAYKAMHKQMEAAALTAMSVKTDFSRLFIDDPKIEGEKIKMKPEDMYPCLFAMVGSGGGLMVVRK